MDEEQLQAAIKEARELREFDETQDRKQSMNRLESIKENMASCTDWYVDNSEFLDDMKWLIQRLERYDKALKDITDMYGVYGLHENYSYGMNEIAEEALKE